MNIYATPSMKFQHCIVMILLVFLSCQSDEEPSILNLESPNDPILNDPAVEQEIPFTVTIDESDLSILPEDTGGSHKAVEKNSTAAPFGYYVYTPEGYEETNHDYPLLIFLHGWNPNLGNEPLENVLNSGPPRLIERNQWNPKFPFIVVSPQLTSNYWSTNKTHAFIEYLMDTYKVNKDRIYLTGLSLGGGGCWYYVGEQADNYVAAIVPISASGKESLVDNLRKVPVWAFHGGLDTTVKAYENFGSVPMVEAINATDPLVKARVTVYPAAAHNAWSMTYDGTGQKWSNQRHDRFEMDIYEWMLAYKKSDQQ